jgi:hypothetical protein
MNSFAYGLGVFYRIWTVISFPICLFLLIIYILTHKTPQTIFTVAPVVAINHDGSTVLLVSNNSSSSYRNVAINVAERISKIIFGYSNDGQYAASAANTSKIFEENSQASRSFREIIQRNIIDSKQSNAVFTLDPKRTIAALDPKDPTIMVVIAQGFQTISTTSGTTTKEVKINLTMYFNEKRGSDGDIFKVYQISFN